MPRRKRFRGEFAPAAAAPAEEATRGCPIPADLLLEIVARSDAATLVRCAATCKPLRRDIRRRAFIHRVCNGGAVPPSLLGFLDLDRAFRPPLPSFSLAHPATPAAASLAETRLEPSLRRRCAGADADRLVGYEPLTSRDGLVLLRSFRWTGMSTSLEMIMCVYDPMAGKGTFFPGPPDATRVRDFGHDCDCDKYVLLTPADGVVGCSFVILAADFSGLQDGSRGAVMVRTFSPSPELGAWSPAIFASHSREPWDAAREPRDGVAVLRGGFIHWLISEDDEAQCYIFTYDVITAASGCIELPAEVPADCRAHGKLHLTSSPCGGRLNLLVADKFEVSVWLLLSAGDDDDGAGSSWARQAVVDTAMTVHYAALRVRNRPYPTGVDIVGSGARSGVVILLPRPWSEFEEAEEGFIVLDLETKEMRAVSKKMRAFVYEVDMASRLSAMKNF